MKINLILWLALLVCGCQADTVNNCLPYKAQIFSVGCGAPPVKVLNKNVSSKIVFQNSFENNVIDVVGLPATVQAGQIFYFDFRELQAGEGAYFCPALFAGSSRKVMLTKFSYSACEGQ